MDKRLKDILKNEGDNYLMPFFWQRGEDEAMLRNEIDKIHKSGIGAMCIESRPHPDFTGPTWWRDMDIIMDEAKKRHMKVWLFDDEHFPTGYAHGWFKTKYPKKGKRYLIQRCIEVDGPKHGTSLWIKEWLNRPNWQMPEAEISMDETLLAVVACKRNKDTGALENPVYDLTDKIQDGIIYWDIPEGSWSVFLMINTQNGGGEPCYMNVIDKDSVRVLIDAVYEPHFEHYGDEFGKTFAGFFFDEACFGNSSRKFYEYVFDDSIGRKKDMILPWNADVCERLKIALGEDFSKLLPCLWQDMGERTWEVRYKYMDIVTKLCSENFVGQISKWCEAHHVEYIGHSIEDQSVHARLGSGLGHFFRAHAGQHMAGVDLIGMQAAPRYVNYSNPPMGPDPDYEFFHFGLAKMGSSLGHIDPKKHGRTLCEVFGVTGWASGCKMHKWIIDHALVRGINHFVPHGFSAKEFPDDDCPPHFYARGRNPQYRYFKYLMEYTNRMCHLLNGGTHIAPAAILYHAESEWSGDYMYFHKPAHRLSESHIDYDILPSDVFGNMDMYQACYKNGKLHVNKEAYSALIIPYCQRITEALERFIYKATDMDFYFIDAFSTGICGEKDDRKTLLASNPPDNCHVVSLEMLSDALKEKGTCDITVSGNADYLRYYHYRRDNTDIYMFFNEHPADRVDCTVHLPVSKKLYKYDAFENTLSHMKHNIDKTGAAFPLALSIYESCVIIAGDIEDAFIIAPQRVDETKGYIKKALEGTWTLSRATALDYPKFSDEISVEQLCDMSRPDRYPDFTGTFRYTFEFDMNDVFSEAVLDLGEVYESAEVWVNGEKAGTRICPPYVLDISKYLTSKNNVIQIDVTNTLVREVCDWMSSTLAIEPSGLLGPVTLQYK